MRLEVRMRRLVFYCLIILFGFFNAAVALKLITRKASAEVDDGGYGNLTVYGRALQLIRQGYVDASKIGYKDLTYSGLRGMLSGLDPQSQFIVPSDFRKIQDESRNQVGTLGIVLGTKEGIVSVVSPTEDTPGFRAGILPGDQILRIDGSTTEKMNLQDATDLLRGPPGQTVALTVFRPSTKQTKEFALQREGARVPSVKDARLLDPSLAGNFKIGYIRVTQFNEPTGSDLALQLDALQRDGMQALILDLRFNPGGLFSSAIDVSGQFLPPNTMVLSTNGRDKSQRREYFTRKKAKIRPNYPLVVLVNGGSANGSEVVAGALKDLNRAILVGDTTYGKGSIQSIVQLPDGSALRLTTAKLYTPAKQVIQDQGIAPNIKASLSIDQERALLLKRRGAPLSADDQKFVNDQKDPQMDRAIDALKGAMIYTQNEKQD
jgi:carboxyl-terminal processing protease